MADIETVLKEQDSEIGLNLHILCNNGFEVTFRPQPPPSAGVYLAVMKRGKQDGGSPTSYTSRLCANWHKVAYYLRVLVSEMQRGVDIFR